MRAAALAALIVPVMILSACGPSGQPAGGSGGAQGKFAGLDGEILTWRKAIIASDPLCRRPGGGREVRRLRRRLQAERTITADDQAKGITARVVAVITWTGFDPKFKHGQTAAAAGGVRQGRVRLDAGRAQAGQHEHLRRPLGDEAGPLTSLRRPDQLARSRPAGGRCGERSWPAPLSLMSAAAYAQAPTRARAQPPPAAAAPAPAPSMEIFTAMARRDQAGRRRLPAVGTRAVAGDRHPHPLRQDQHVQGRGGPHLVAAGYAMWCRTSAGKGHSQGFYAAFVNDIEDGYDTVEGLAREPWSNGRIGITARRPWASPRTWLRSPSRRT